ncbi:MAG: cytochrome c3 family protein [Candidatus Binatia bacterium]
MAQIFHPSTNTISRLSIFGLFFLLIGLLWILAAINRSSYVTEAGVVREQPVPFSHQHHVGGLGIDCRYCHASVEQSSFAGIPATEICMSCHSQIWAASDMLKPVRESFKTGAPIRWTRVHNLPDFVYFNHSIHVRKGVGCATCHGQVDRMPLMRQAESLQMEWCLACHRDPAPFLRPKEFVFSMDWQPPQGEEIALEQKLMNEYEIESPELLTSCSTCHR